MRYRLWAWTVACANGVFGCLGVYIGIAVMYAASAGLRSPHSGPEQYGMGMFVGGFGLGLVVFSVLLLSLAAAGIVIAKRTARGVLPGFKAKTCLALGTLVPLLGASAAAMVWIAGKSGPH